MTKKIVIAGAGIGGLCFALAAVQKGLDVVVHEQAAELAEVGAGLQLSPNAMHVLNALGLGEKTAQRAFTPKAAVMRHYKSGHTYFSVPLADNSLQRYGAAYLHVHRADLQQLLYQACVEAGVKIHLAQAVQSYHHTPDSLQPLLIQLENDNSVEADVLVGADGIKSAVRTQMLAQQAATAEFTGQVAWRGTVAANKLPPGLVKPNANLWVGPGRHMVSYYVRGGEYVNFVAVEERTDWRNESWNEEGDVQQLRTAFSGWHPEVTEVLEAAENCFLWALFARKPLSSWNNINVTLLGDACHPMLPFLAQGAAMAIEDGYALAHYLDVENNTSTALSKYQSLRLERTSQIQLNAHKNAGLYHMSSPLEQAKLMTLSWLSSSGLSQKMAQFKLDSIYGYNLVERLKSK